MKRRIDLFLVLFLVAFALWGCGSRVSVSGDDPNAAYSPATSGEEAEGANAQCAPFPVSSLCEVRIPAPPPIPSPKAVLTVSDGPICDLGQVPIGWSTDKMLTVTNTGIGTAKNLQNWSYFPTYEFRFKGGIFPGQGGTCAVGQSLVVGQSCTLMITFTPDFVYRAESRIHLTYLDEGYPRSGGRSVRGSGTFCIRSDPDFGGGIGTPEDPYLIYNVSQLQNVHDHVGCHFKLMSDLNLAGIPFAPLGDPGPSGYVDLEFSGSFDGNNHAINNFTFANAQKNYVGFFAYVAASGTIKNLRLGALEVTGNSMVGGLAGWIDAQLSPDRKLWHGTIENCSVTGKVTGGTTLGGLAGYSTGNILNSSSSATVTGVGYAWYVGGLAGVSIGGKISRSHATGDLFLNGSANQVAGGLVGEIGTNEVGPSVKDPAVIETSYATGAIHDGRSWVGGFAGAISDASVKNCYSAGTVSAGGYRIGGFAGEMLNATLANSYSASVVSIIGGALDVGGLIGGRSNSAVTNSFWDITLNSSLPDDGNGRSTAFLKTQSGYPASWDFTNVWVMPAVSYPLLR
ncbi:MAG: GLUG motif-containing protein [Pseudomonadota bacterium]